MLKRVATPSLPCCWRGRKNFPPLNRNPKSVSKLPGVMMKSKPQLIRMRWRLVLLPLLVMAACLFSTRMPAGEVRVWGLREDYSSYHITIPPDLTNAVSVSLTHEGVMILLADQTVRVINMTFLGSTNYGYVIPGLTNAVRLERIYIQKSDGHWGIASPQGWIAVPHLTNAVHVSYGNKFDQEKTIALKDDGSVWASTSHLGWTALPLVEAATNLIDVATTFAPDFAHYALSVDGRVVRWYYDWDNRFLTNKWITTWLPNLTNAVAIDGYSGVLAVLCEDGSVYQKPWLSNVVQITANAALKSNGEVVTWVGNTNVPHDLPFATFVASGADYGMWGAAAAVVIPDLAATPPTIPSAPTPVNRTAQTGATVWFTSQAFGFPPLNYQWYFGDTLLPGETNTVLRLVNVQTTNSGLYSVLVSNPAGQTRSAAATLSVVTSLQLHLVPRITLIADVGQDYRLEFIHPLGPTNNWNVLDLISITNNPQFYYDISAIGQPQRYYRLSATNAP